MTEPARHLHLADPSTGELYEACPGCAERDQKIESLRTEKKGWQARFYKLREDKREAARAHAAWPKAVAIFDYWREKCDHSKATFTADRFWLIEPFLHDYGEAACRKAIDGAAYDPFKTTRKNGTPKRHDGIDLIFRSAEKFEEFQARAPIPRAVDLLATELPPLERNRAAYAPDGAWLV